MQLGFSKESLDSMTDSEVLEYFCIQNTIQELQQEQLERR